MSDSKTPYSEASHYYVEEKVAISVIDRSRYERSKDRQRRFNDNWEKAPVNLNDIVDKFAPGDGGREHGVKYYFEGKKYRIEADMVAGYLRIYDKIAKSYVKLDGTPSKIQSETHFKILKREEM